MIREILICVSITYVTSQVIEAEDIALNSVIDSEVENATITYQDTKIPKTNLVCPGMEGTPALTWYPFLSKVCNTNQDCQVFDPTQLCCITTTDKKRCIKGVPKPHVEPPHYTFLGMRRRVCPKIGGWGHEPLAVFGGEVKECSSDRQCWPLQICCADPPLTGNNANLAGAKSYCRTPVPKFDSFPYPVIIREPLQNFVSYVQCTPPPPPFLDLFPKSCRTAIDCFPNVCCLERGGKRFCRPPKRSVLAVIAAIAQTFGNSVRNQFVLSQRPLGSFSKK